MPFQIGQILGHEALREWNVAQDHGFDMDGFLSTFNEGKKKQHQIKPSSNWPGMIGYVVDVQPTHCIAVYKLHDGDVVQMKWRAAN